MPLFGEKSLVEDYFIQKLQGKGWKFTLADNLERESPEEPLLTPVLIRKLKQLNTHLSIRDDEIKQVLNELKLRGSGSEDAKKILYYFRQGVPIKFEKDRTVHNVKLLDYDSIQNNEFVISRQVIHQSGNKEIRNDIILYINGIPLVNIECKNPTSLTETWQNAYTQIRDYQKDVPELYKYVQLGVAAESKACYFPTAPWQQEDVKIHTWLERPKDSIDSTIEMLTPATLLNIIRNYTFIRIEHGATTKVITRYMQYKAAEKIYNRALNHIQGKDPKNKGLIWHWQGSGKTLTMIFAANKLYHAPELENPTIFFIIDREDLQEQLYTEYTALDIPKPETTYSIEQLRRMLAYDQGKGKRGIHICLIQKFRPEEFQQLHEALKKLSKNQETILTRKNVTVFIDEGHRSQYGTLAGQMKELFKNASLYAFTGTPIAIGHKNTYKEYSYPPEDPYLDKYFMKESIEDGYTLKLTYQPRLEKDAHLKKEMLDTFFQVETEEIPEEYREPVKEEVKEKLNEINIRLEKPDRIKKVAKDIAQHFAENLDGKFKAMLVAASRLACVRYKKELDTLLPKEYTEVVFNPGKSKRSEVNDYIRELTATHRGKDPNDINKETVTKYKEEDYPKILIVTDMLLTGFDAPILQTMYLDKALKGHRLLQAIARTNRPYKDIKDTGLIIDYVGIIKNFYKAFENYTKDDVQDIIINLTDYRQEFTNLLDQTLKLFENIPKDKFDLTTMRQAIETITQSEQKTKQFEENYRKLRKLFETLGTDYIKLERLSEYTWLSKVYVYYYKQVKGNDPTKDKYVEKYFTKTLKYVYTSTQLEDLQTQMPLIKFDADYVKNLEEKLKTKEEKAANIVFALNRFILVERERNPIYESLAERVEKILKHWKERKKDYDLIITQGLEVFKDKLKLEERKDKLGFNELQYYILITLEKKLGTDQKLLQDVKELTDQLQPQMFKGWYYQLTARKNIEREIRKYLRKYVKQKTLNMNDFDPLYQKIMESVKTYGQKT